MSDVALGWVLIGVNILFLGVNIYGAEMHLRRRRRAIAVEPGPTPFVRELADAMHTTLRLRRDALEAALRLEGLLAEDGVRGTRLGVELRAVIRALGASAREQ